MSRLSMKQRSGQEINDKIYQQNFYGKLGSFTTFRSSAILMNPIITFWLFLKVETEDLEKEPVRRREKKLCDELDVVSCQQRNICQETSDKLYPMERFLSNSDFLKRYNIFIFSLVKRSGVRFLMGYSLVTKRKKLFFLINFNTEFKNSYLFNNCLVYYQRERSKWRGSSSRSLHGRCLWRKMGRDPEITKRRYGPRNSPCLGIQV